VKGVKARLAYEALVFRIGAAERIVRSGLVVVHMRANGTYRAILRPARLMRGGRIDCRDAYRHPVFRPFAPPNGVYRLIRPCAPDQRAPNRHRVKFFGAHLEPDRQLAQSPHNATWNGWPDVSKHRDRPNSSSKTRVEDAIEAYLAVLDRCRSTSGSHAGARRSLRAGSSPDRAAVYLRSSALISSSSPRRNQALASTTVSLRWASANNFLSALPDNFLQQNKIILMNPSSNTPKPELFTTAGPQRRLALAALADCQLDP